jgi:hypothetical protein
VCASMCTVVCFVGLPGDHVVAMHLISLMHTYLCILQVEYVEKALAKEKKSLEKIRAKLLKIDGRELVENDHYPPTFLSSRILLHTVLSPRVHISAIRVRQWHCFLCRHENTVPYDDIATCETLLLVLALSLLSGSASPSNAHCCILT